MERLLAVEMWSAEAMDWMSTWRVLLPVHVGLASLCAGCCFVPPLDSAPTPALTTPVSAAPPVPVSPPPIPPPPQEAADLIPRMGISGTLIALEIPQRPWHQITPLFNRARESVASVARGLLICTTDLHQEFDHPVFGGSDIAMNFRIADGDWHPTPQLSDRIFTMPLTDLQPGVILGLRVVDRDVFEDDVVATESVTFASAPFEVTTPAVTLLCRVVDVASQVQRAVERVMRLLERFRLPVPDLNAPGLGFRSPPRLHALVDDAASWVGWTAPEMLGVIDRAEAFDQAFEERVGARVVQALGTLPAPGEVVRMAGRTARVERVFCGSEAADLYRAMGPHMRQGVFPCQAVLEVTATAPITITVPRSAPGELSDAMWSFQRSGERDRAQLIAIQHDGAWHPMETPLSLARGESVHVHIGLSRRGQLLRTGRELAARSTVLRLE